MGSQLRVEALHKRAETAEATASRLQSELEEARKENARQFKLYEHWRGCALAAEARLAAQPDVRGVAREITNKFCTPITAKLVYEEKLMAVEAILNAHLAPQAGVPNKIGECGEPAEWEQNKAGVDGLGAEQFNTPPLSNEHSPIPPASHTPRALVPRILRFLESNLAGNDPARVVKEPHRFGDAHVELCELIIELRKADNESGEELLTKFESLCYDRKVDYALRANLLSRLGGRMTPTKIVFNKEQEVTSSQGGAAGVPQAEPQKKRMMQKPYGGEIHEECPDCRGVCTEYVAAQAIEGPTPGPKEQE